MLCAAAGGALWLAPTPSDGQEGEPPALPYTIEIAPTGEAPLDAAARAVSALVRLRETAPTDAFGLAARARSDLPRFVEALRSEGHYGGTVAVTLGGLPLDAPELEARLAESAGPVAVRVVLDPGPQYRIGRIATAAEPPEAQPALDAAAPALGVAPGDPARAAPVLDAASAVVVRLRRAGHPLAAVSDQDVVVDHDTRTMDIAWRFAPGPVARFAPPRVENTGQTDAGLAQRVAARRLGDGVYTPEAVERARRALLGLGPFGTVRVEEARALDEEGRLPVTFTVTERPRRLVGFGLGYETNFGPTARAYWEHRNLFGGAERLRIEGEVSRIGERGISEASFNAFATYRLPEVFRRDIQLALRGGALRERLDAYDRDAVLLSAIFERPATERLVLQGGPGYEAGRVGRNGSFLDFQYVSLLLGLRYDGTDNLLNPTRGYRFNATATPYLSAGEGASFTRLLATASAYFRLASDAGTVLALRASLGSAVGASRDEIPLDKRFYAGGGGSVRGFAFQGIGPRDATNRPLGGTSLVEGSVELRQRITGNWGAVAFVDAGSVGAGAAPSFSDIRVGAGVGVRYLTAIGPVRLDVAVPLNRQRGDPGFGLYVGIGQAF
jgi:translocation and assembly module TamA